MTLPIGMDSNQIEIYQMDSERKPHFVIHGAHLELGSSFDSTVEGLLCVFIW